MEKPIGIAIAGIGKIARDQHVPSLRSNVRFDLVATVDPHAALDGIAHFPDIGSLRASGLAVDALAICTPPQMRGAIARTAIAAGLHVLLEKPPAATLAEFADLRQRGAAAGVTLFAAWHSRFAPKISDAQAWLADRTVIGGQVIWREDVRLWHPGQAWLWAPGGLGVFDPAINAFSILTLLLPNAITVAAARLEVPQNAHTPIAALLSLRSGDASIAADLDFLQTGLQTWDIAIETSCGHHLRLSDGGSRMSIDGVEQPAAPNREYAALYDRFASLIAAGESDADAAPLQMVADALLMGELHRVQAFDE